MKNTASPQDVARVIRGAVSSLSDEKYITSDLCKIVDHYEVTIMDVLRLTSRPNKGVLRQGSVEAFAEESPEETQLFADRLYDAIQMCKDKSKSMTTGKKLSEPVRRVCAFINRQACTEHVSQEPSKRPSRVSTGSRTSTGSEHSARKEKLKQPLDAEAIKSSILSLYGLGAGRCNSSSSSAGPAADAFPEEPMIVMSSQESSPVKPRPTKEAESFVDFVINRKRALCRAFSSGRKEYAVMRSGAGGFALARFPGTDKDIQTEIPNALLDVQAAPVMKRPAAPLSSKVAKKAKEAAAREEATAEEEAAEGEGEEEEPVEEDLPSTEEYPDTEEQSTRGVVVAAPAAAVVAAVEAGNRKPRRRAATPDEDRLLLKIPESRMKNKAVDRCGNEISWFVCEVQICTRMHSILFQIFRFQVG